MAPYHERQRHSAIDSAVFSQLFNNTLGEWATYRRLTNADAAGTHCHVGASDYANGVVLDWLEEVLAGR